MSLHGPRPGRRRSIRAAALLSAALSLALTAGSVQAVAAARPAETGRSRPGVQQTGDPVKGTAAKVKPRRTDAARKASVTRLHPAVWPKAGGAEIPVGAAGAPGKAKIGGLPVAVSPAAPAAATATATARRTARTAAGGSPSRVRVDLLDHKQAATLGAGVVLKVRGADTAAKGSGRVRLSIDYSAFAQASGGDYGARLRLYRLPDCALTASPGSRACPEKPRPLASVNDPSGKTLSAQVDLPAAGAPAAGTRAAATSTATPLSGTTLLAVAAGSSSSQGNYAATALSPSASWNVTPSSGGFSWNYPLRTVPTPGGLVPSIGLGYSSQAVDGRTATTNNQGSWIGEGFSYEPGYVERAYKACADDGHADSGEQCWAFDNATVLLNGSSNQLVKDDTTGDWHLSNDDGSKVEKLTGTVNGDNDGEYWKITTPDGTQYFFGLNRRPGWATGNPVTNSTWTVPVFGDDSGEPCYNATFTSAWCQQAWRWNLDYVKDLHGNVISYTYGQETNHYALNGRTDVNGTAYHRGGYLTRIEYGQRESTLFTEAAPARVAFTTAERCIPTVDFDCAETKWTSANQAYWPDTPFDRYCAPNTKCTASQASPSFWTRKRLTGITTQIRTGATTYTDVDAWTLTHLFTDNGDSSQSLWLSKIGHEGRHGGTAALPSVELYGMQLANRVDVDGDNIPPLQRFRLATVLSETGSQLDVNYAPTDCTTTALPAPGESTKRCFPVKWAPPGTIDPITDWFHKYVVAEVVQVDRTGGGDTMATRYNYQGAAGWRHAEPDGLTDAKFLTWGQWQGYGKVTVTSGTPQEQKTRIDYTYLQGLDGDQLPGGGTRTEKVTDSTGVEHTGYKEFTGFELEAATYDGAKLVARSLKYPWRTSTATDANTWGTTKAWIVQPEVVRGFTALEGGGWRETKSTTTYNATNGRQTRAEDLGDVSTAADDTCTRTTYADNTAAGIISLPSRIETVAVNCSATPDRRTQVIKDERTSYDGLAWGAAPTRGLATTTERLASHDGTTATYQTTGTTNYDAWGRPLDQTDAVGAKTTTAYTQTNGLTTSVKVTNALGHVTATEYAPAWGQSLAQVDANNKRTELAYDPLGRISSVWLPDRTNTQTPSIKYSYLVRQDAATAVKTEKIDNGGGYGAEYQLYDSLLRPRQMQTEGPSGTRMVADTFYDGLGKVAKTNGTYNAAGAASDQLLTVPNGSVGSQTLLGYDGLGRTTAQIYAISGDEQWRTTTVYGGDRVHVDPPVGGTPTTVISDAAGRTTELRQYHGSSPVPTGTVKDYQATTYEYTPAGQPAKVADHAGDDADGIPGNDLGHVWTFTYDQRGRKVASTDPDAGAVSYGYDDADRLTSTTDARGRTVTTEYDKLGRTTFTWEGAKTTGTKLTEHRYDTLFKGQPYASFRYLPGSEYYATVYQAMDAFYRPLKTAYSVPASEGALKGVYTYSSAYNRDGTVQSLSMPGVGGLPAETLTFGYDALQRPTTLTGTTPYVTATTWGPTSLLQQLELSNGGAKTWETFFYEKGTDRLTRAVTDLENVATPARDAQYSYDQVGNVLSIADQAPATGGLDAQCFTYDGMRRMTEAWTPAADTTTAAGSGTVGSGMNGARPSACTAAPGAGPLGGPAPYWSSHTFDSTGNRLSETVHDTGLDPAKDVVRTYGYADADQDGTPGEAADPQTGQIFDGGPHAVTKVTETGPTGSSNRLFRYDASGNTDRRTIGGNTQVLDWDAEGQLVKATEAGGAETSYIYDADGSRIRRKDPTGTTVYLPGTELRLAGGSSTPTATRYYQHAGTTVAVRTAADKLSWLVSDHHGTGELTVDAATQTVVQRRQDPYGNPRGTQPQPGAWPGEKGFVGGTIDASTGLTSIGAREYDTYLGKFVSPDPVVDFTDPQQVNAYAYANNSPITSSDPTGLRVDAYEPFCYSHAYLCSQVANQDAADKVAEQTKKEAQNQVASAEASQSAARQKLKQAAKVLVKIAMDELGISAALDCFSSGNVSACGETALNVAGSFAGGMAGKLLAKYGLPWKWAKATRLVKRVWGLVDKLIDGVQELWSSSKAVSRAKEWLGKVEATTCHSFLPGTKVQLADGKQKDIAEVELGDRVVTTDPKTGETTTRQVVATIVTEDDKHFVDLTVATASGKSAIVATDTHPFWVVNAHRWVDAGYIEPGMTLRTPSGDTVPVTAVRHFDKRQRTHDLTVEDIHTYYVLAGATPVLAHNCSISPHEVERTEQLGGDRDRERVDQIAESMTRDGWVGEPIEVFENLNRRYVINGHHRVAAAKKAGIDVQYRSLTLDEIKAYKYKSADEVVWASIEVGGDFPEERRGRRRR